MRVAAKSRGWEVAAPCGLAMTVLFCGLAMTVLFCGLAA